MKTLPKEQVAMKKDTKVKSKNTPPVQVPANGGKMCPQVRMDNMRASSVAAQNNINTPVPSCSNIKSTLKSQGQVEQSADINGDASDVDRKQEDKSTDNNSHTDSAEYFSSSTDDEEFDDLPKIPSRRLLGQKVAKCVLEN